MSDDILEALTGIVAVATLPVGILAGVFVNGQAAAIVFVVGWLLLVPVLGILQDHVDLGAESTTYADREPVSTSDDESDDALQRLRERYAAGEIDEAEFERRLEALLETEDLDLPPGADPSTGSTTRDDVTGPTNRDREPNPTGDEPEPESTDGGREPDLTDGEREPDQVDDEREPEPE